jgi:antitoxin YefM
MTMQTLSVHEASMNLSALMGQTAMSHQPIMITGNAHNAVLMSQDDWSSIQETLYLLSIPNMRESILAGMAEPIENCATELSW